jgi:hypothetical protein
VIPLRSGTGGLDFAYRRNAGAEPTLRMSFLNTIDAGPPKYHSVAMPISVLQERYGSARVSRCAGDRAGGVIWWREAQSTDTYDERDGTWTRPVVNDHHPPQNLLRRFAAISFWHRTAGSAALPRVRPLGAFRCRHEIWNARLPARSFHPSRTFPRSRCTQNEAGRPASIDELCKQSLDTNCSPASKISALPVSHIDPLDRPIPTL